MREINPNIWFNDAISAARVRADDPAQRVVSARVGDASGVYSGRVQKNRRLYIVIVLHYTRDRSHCENVH